MTRSEMAQFLTNHIFFAIDTVREDGQKEYSHDDENAFANFEREAEKHHISREKVLLIHLDKHMDGILAWSNGHRSQREPVEGRIKDAIMYLSLLWGMVEDEKRKTVPGYSEDYSENDG